MTQPEPHVVRMLAEVRQLEEKTSSLAAFLQTPQFAELSTDDQSLLTAQGGAMTAYLMILTMRLGRTTYPTHHTGA